MKKRNWITQYATVHEARRNCLASGNTEWADRWASVLSKLENMLPSGSGLDAGTTVLGINPTTITFETAFHHINDAGFYDGWTEHRVTAKATLSGIEIKVTGPNRNEIRAYLADLFCDALTSEIDEVTP